MLRELSVPLLVILGIAIFIVPWPSWMLDAFIALSISLAILVLILTMYVKSPLDFTSFPSLILLLAIYRLFLNVATTRAILTDAYAGKFIQTFSSFVLAGGGYTIGIAIFIIIVVINFAVIAFGSQRIAEVAARFTLDALPGKQLSIDADLNAGLIDEAEARRRRRELEREADYFGAMDGASRFVQRDAVVAIFLVFINIIVGLIVGTMVHGMTLGEAAQVFTQLTIGDGLVAQIPALMVSTATGLMVTKQADERTLGEAAVVELGQVPRVLYVASGVMLFMALIPGMPKLVLAAFALGLAGAAFYQTRLEVERALRPQKEEAEEEKTAPTPQEELAGLLQVDPLELEIGYGLIPLVDKEQGGDLLDRIANLRRQIALSLGFIVPPIRIRDNITLDQGEYVIKVQGTPVAKGSLVIDRYLAMNPVQEGVDIEGIETTEPAFGLRAFWIEPEMRMKAEAMGFTVVDPTTVLTTHLSEVIKRHAPELLTREAVKELVDQLRENRPAAVEGIVPERVSLELLTTVLRGLLEERVSIRNLPLIIEALAQHRAESDDPDFLIEKVRQALRRQIVAGYLDESGTLMVATFSPQLEQRIADSLRQTPEGTMTVLSPSYLRRVLEAMEVVASRMVNQGYTPLFLVGPRIRPYVAKIARRIAEGAAVVSFSEIEPGVDIKTIAVVDVPPDMGSEGEPRAGEG